MNFDESGRSQSLDRSQLEGSYDYIVVGAGASGSVVAGELSKGGADVLVMESGGADAGPTISNPSIWFYNVGGPLDWKLPIAPASTAQQPQVQDGARPCPRRRQLHQRDGLVARHGTRLRQLGTNGAAGLQGRAPDVQGAGRLGRRRERGAAGRPIIRKPGPASTAPPSSSGGRWASPILDDMNGPMRPGAGYINMNIAADGSRVSAARAFLRPNLERPNLTLLLNTNATKVVFDGDRAVGVQIVTDDGVRTIRATARSDPSCRHDPQREAADAVRHRRRRRTRESRDRTGRQPSRRRAEPPGPRAAFRRGLQVQRQDARPSGGQQRGRSRGLSIERSLRPRYRVRTPPAGRTCWTSRGPHRQASGIRSEPRGSARTSMLS